MAVNRLCRWGMHRPGPHKIFHQGMQFTRCVDCDASLVTTHKGWKPIPAGKRVVWRDRTDKDPFFRVMPNYDRTRLKLDPLAPLRRR